MSDSSANVMPAADQVVAAVRQLHEAQQHLFKLTGGKVDAVVHPDGQSYLLHQAQEQLRESETRQRALATTQISILNALPAHIALLDTHGVILSVNESWRLFASENMPQESDPGIGRNYLEVCDQAEGDCSKESREVAAGIRQVLTGERVQFALEYPCHSPTKERWFRLVVAPIREGALDGAVVMHINITERKMAEAAIRESERELRTLAESMPQMVWMARADGWNTYFNQRWIEYTGISLKESYGHGWIKPIHPDDRRRAWDAWQAAMDGHSPYDLECRVRGGDGGYRWMLIRGLPYLDAATKITKWFGTCTDIDDLKKAYEAAEINERRQRELATELDAERARLSKVLNSSLDVICTFDATGCFLNVNAACETLWGYRPEELLGKPYIDMVCPEDQQRTRDAAADVIAGNATRAFENRYMRKDGTPAEVMWSARWSEPDQSMFCVARDVTERNKHEQQLRLLETCVSRLNDVVLICTAEGFNGNEGPRIIFVNTAFEQLTGYTSAEAIGQSPPQLLHGPRTDQAVVDRIHTALQNRQAIRAELIHYTKAGMQYWNEISIVPIFSADGTMTHFVSVERDNTNAVLAREHIAQQAELIDQARDAILVRGMDRKISLWNKSAERIYGWSAEEASGGRTDDLLLPDHSELMRIEQEILENGEWNGELQKVTKANVKVTMDCRWSLLRDGYGQPKGFLQIETDISERKKVEQQFLRAQRMESIGTLAGGIAHDLNNVLGPIMMGIEVLKINCPDTESQHLLGLIGISAQRGADMVSQVLSFARGVEGKRMEVQVHHLVTDIVQIANDTFLKHIEITNHFPQKLWSVQGDPTQLHQVLLNLCVNARDAMPNGGRLSITAENIRLDEHYAAMETEAKAGPYILLQVEDTGSGIPPGIIEKIFDPFFTTKEIGKGTGLGLSTTMAIIKSHGGFLRVYSELGKGTKFKVHLPADPDSSDVTVEDAKAKLPRGNGELILIIDDESTVRQVTQQTLEAFGYRTVIASDGPEAVVIYARRGDEVAVVLTDMMMPGMDGYATIQALKKMNPSVRIIAASGLALNEHVARAANLGVTDFLPKPFRAEKLLNTLSQILKRN